MATTTIASPRRCLRRPSSPRPADRTWGSASRSRFRPPASAKSEQLDRLVAVHADHGRARILSPNVTPYSESYTLSIEHEIAATCCFAPVTSAPGASSVGADFREPRQSRAMPELEQSRERDAGNRDMRPLWRERTSSRAPARRFGTRGPFDGNFAAVTWQKTIGNSNYNALEMTLRHSGPTFSDRLHLREISGPIVESLGSGQSSQSAIEQGASAFDMRHNLVASYDWKLPFGKLPPGYRVDGGLVAFGHRALQHRLSRDPVQQQRHFAVRHDSQWDQ